MLDCYVNIFEILQEPPKIKKWKNYFSDLQVRAPLNDLTITDNKTYRGKKKMKCTSTLKQ